MSKTAIDCDIDPGNYNILITFKTEDDDGDYTNLLGQAWGRIELLTGREDNEADMLESKTRYKITSRFPTSFEVKPEDRAFATIMGTAQEREMRILSVGTKDFVNKALVILAEDWQRDDG
jgi:hypothetical protein